MATAKKKTARARSRTEPVWPAGKSMRWGTSPRRPGGRHQRSKGCQKVGNSRKRVEASRALVSIVQRVPRLRAGIRGRYRRSSPGPRSPRWRPPRAKGPVADPGGRFRVFDFARADLRGPASSRGTHTRGSRLPPATRLSPIPQRADRRPPLFGLQHQDRSSANDESLQPSVRSGC